MEDLPSLSLLSRNFDPDSNLGIVDAVYSATLDVFDFIDSGFNTSKAFPFPQIALSRRLPQHQAQMAFANFISSSSSSTLPSSSSSSNVFTASSFEMARKKSVDKFLAGAKKIGKQTASFISPNTSSSKSHDSSSTLSLTSNNHNSVLDYSNPTSGTGQEHVSMCRAIKKKKYSCSMYIYLSK